MYDLYLSVSSQNVKTNREAAQMRFYPSEAKIV
jgi:hypothetical protein